MGTTRLNDTLIVNIFGSVQTQLENKTVDIWFDKAPLGKNTLEDKMKNLSKQLNLSKLYTNHSLRATTITLLDNKRFEARHIMSISGHKTESSILII
jgi:integrase